MEIRFSAQTCMHETVMRARFEWCIYCELQLPEELMFADAEKDCNVDEDVIGSLSLGPPDNKRKQSKAMGKYS